MSRILVVDDDELVRMNLEMVLRMEGYEVRTADSGETALDVATQFEPDVVVLDITMPGMGGWAALAQFRIRSGGAALPILALTGEARDPADFRKAGFNAHLPKGGSLDQFLCIVRSALVLPRNGGGHWLHSCNGCRCLVARALDPVLP
jgi:CheY-like chemotaxis protein